MSLQPFAVAPVMGLLAATPVAGYTLVNGTGTILSWTAPGDGQLHRVLLVANEHVTVAQTGGAISLATTAPDAATFTTTVVAGGNGTGLAKISAAGNGVFLVQAGTTVTLAQQTAQTAGTATLWAELWGS